MKKALEDSYRCRSAYKLIELDDRFHFLQPGRVVIDCGASPGYLKTLVILFEHIYMAGVVLCCQCPN